VVERAPRGRDHHVHAGAQRVKLAPDGLAAVDRQHAHAERLAVAVHRLRDLHRELARRHEDDRGGPLALPLVHDALQDRQREGRRLPRSGRGLAQQVASRDERRDGLLWIGVGSS
jgi:hypothetical protein